MADTIKYIFDMDGYSLGKHFHCKELAVVNLFSREAALLRFELDVPFRNLTESEKRTVWYTIRNCHGMDYVNNPGDLPSCEVELFIGDLLMDCEENGHRIAFKGGNLERKLLMKLNAQPESYVNLESPGYRLPRFNELKRDGNFDKVVDGMKFSKLLCRSKRPQPGCRWELNKDLFESWDGMCNRHRRVKKNVIAHCPLEEVCYFAAWVLKHD